MSIPRISAKFETTLSLKVNVGDTTGSLTTVVDAGGTALPDGTYGFTIDEGNSDFEYIEATIVSNALSSVVSFSETILTETVGFTKAHRAGAEVKITDFTILGHLSKIFRGTEQLDPSAPLSYSSGPTLSDVNALATVQYVLDNITGGAVTFNSNVIAGVAGETLTAGDWVYLKESDGRWYQTDANEKATSVSVKIGKALGAGTTGAAITTGVFVGGVETTGTYVAATKYYLSNTAGQISTSAGEESVLVGIGDANTNLIFVNIYDPESVTQDEKDALVGTLGDPSTDNKYVTESNKTAYGTDQTQTTDDGSVEFGEADATTKKNKIAQSFKPKKDKIRGVNLRKEANTGDFVGTVTVELQEDDGSGDPDGTTLATVTLSNKFSGIATDGEVEAVFTAEYDMDTTKTYWIVVTSSTSSNTDHPNIAVNSAGGYSDGSLKYWNTTDGWTDISGQDLYFETLEGVNDQVVQTDSSGKIAKDFFDTEKMPMPMYFQEVASPNITTNIITTRFAASDINAENVLISSTSTRNTWTRNATGYYNYTALSSTSSTGTTNFSYEHTGACVVGDYVYIAGTKTTPNPDEWGVVRMDFPSLGNPTEMTIPTITIADPTEERKQLWTDGTYLYMQALSTTTVYKFEIDGTVLTTVTTGTIHADLDNAQSFCHAFNGKDMYRLDQNPAGVCTLYKASDEFFNTYTTVGTYTVYELADNDLSGSGYTPLLAFVDEKRFYIGNTVQTGWNASNVTYGFRMVPFSI